MVLGNELYHNRQTFWYNIGMNLLKSDLTSVERRKIARAWLRNEQRRMLPSLRGDALLPSPFQSDVTLITYTFPEDEDDFDFIEFAIRQSWRSLGILKTVIVADRMTARLSKFASAHPDFIDVQLESSLRPGDLSSMSDDCILRLHERFASRYCLIIQDDGFPINDNLGDFLGKYDFIGAPAVRDVPAQCLVDVFRCACLNGGFSLRSRRICRDAARQWKFWRHFVKLGSYAHTEDVFYTVTACRNPFYRIRNRFPSCRVARNFSLPDFDGLVDIRGMKGKTFGVHGPTAIWQMLA